MNFSIKVKAGHPTMSYHRGGLAFGTAPIVISEEEATEEIRNDPWLVVTETDEAVTNPAEEIEEEEPQEPVTETIPLDRVVGVTVETEQLGPTPTPEASDGSASAAPSIGEGEGTASPIAQPDGQPEGTTVPNQAIIQGGDEVSPVQPNNPPPQP